MPTFDGKSEKFELFEDLFRMSLKIHNHPTEDDRMICFHSLMRGDALQAFIREMAHSEITWKNSDSFPKEVHKAPINGDREA